MAVVVVRRHVHLVRRRAGGDLHGLPGAVPHHVDDGHVHRPLAKIGQERRQADERFARSHGVRADGAHIRQRWRVFGVDLGPEQVEVRQGAQDAPIAFWIRVVVEVQQDVHVIARAFAEGVQVAAQFAHGVAFDVALRRVRRAEPGRETAHAAAARHGAEVEDVGLERREAALAHLLAERLHAVQVRDGGRIVVRPGDAPSAAVRPVDAHGVAHLAAKQIVARHAEGLGLGVQERVLDGANAHRHHAGHGLPGAGVQALVDALDVVYALAHHHRREFLHHRGDADGALVLVVFAPAHHAVFGGEFHEVVVAPTRVAMASFDGAYLHGGFKRLWETRSNHTLGEYAKRAPKGRRDEGPKEGAARPSGG